MTKLGTPIGAGPKGAIVAVGLAAVGEPPLVNDGEPPLELRAPAERPPWRWGRRRRRRCCRRRRWRRRGSRCGRRRRRVPPSIVAPALTPLVGGGAGRSVPAALRCWLPVDGCFRFLAGVGGRGAVGVFAVDEAVVVVVESVRAGRRGDGRSRRRGRERGDRFQGFGGRDVFGAGEADTERRDDAKAGQRDGQCELVSHTTAPLSPLSQNVRPMFAFSLCNKARPSYWLAQGRATARAAAPNKPLINVCLMPAGREDFSRAGCAG